MLPKGQKSMRSIQARLNRAHRPRRASRLKSKIYIIGSVVGGAQMRRAGEGLICCSPLFACPTGLKKELF